MKLRGHRVELVTEYAKDLTYEDAHCTLGNQLAILGEQDRRLRRLESKLDYVITDSPLLIGLLYVRPPYDEDWFVNAVHGAFSSYDNINILLRRVKPYQTYGRSQTEAQAIRLDERLAAHLRPFGHFVVDGDEHAPEAIYSAVFPAIQAAA